MKLFIALFFSAFVAVAQTPEVPRHLTFAGMKLTIHDDARKEIQKDVQALTASPKHFQLKAERARMYFPLIEKIFLEEGVPEDFKFLVLQESSLTADAVSSSNAVGFWQFKDFTAVEMGLRVDKEIDERMNIASSTRAAARYLKKNNTIFNNWLYALQSYQMGAGGVMRSVEGSHSGKTEADITSRTYWYVKKFLAHKIAFGEAVEAPPAQEVIAFENRRARNLSDLAKEVAVDEAVLQELNKWARKGSVPDDRTYVVIIPSSGRAPENAVVAVNQPVVKGAVGKVTPTNNLAVSHVVTRRVNGVRAIQPQKGETPTTLAARAGVDLSDFLRWNEIDISSKIDISKPYFLAKKRAKSKEDYHQVAPGETLWAISQMYGVRMRKLKRYNRMDSEKVQPGTTLWLSATKPRDAEAPVLAASSVQVNPREVFAWDDVPAETPKEPVSVPQTSEPDTTATAAQSTTTPVPTPPTVPVVAADSTPASISITPPQKPSSHTVQPGETLSAISRLYQIPVMELVNMNQLNLQEPLKPGQVLKLVPSESVVTEAIVDTGKKENAEVVHEVQSSDTLYGIARKYGVTIRELMEWNDKKDFSLSIGEKLKIQVAR